ncbi:MAG TPA: hypothetical protein VFV72_12615 [Candidatus Limnocylindrales bacterium]|nr:hypothetical protein [Candidatus Limnocylindrales bacterium]
MDQRFAADSADLPAPDQGEPAAIDFVRFCYHRRKVGWPELYDEMCAVAGRGLFHGYTVDDLSGIGVGLTLFELPATAAIVQRVVAEDQERRRRTAHAIRSAHVERSEPPVAIATTEAPSVAPLTETPAVDAEPVETAATDHHPRLMPLAAGA